MTKKEDIDLAFVSIRKLTIRMSILRFFLRSRVSAGGQARRCEKERLHSLRVQECPAGAAFLSAYAEDRGLCPWGSIILV